MTETLDSEENNWEPRVAEVPFSWVNVDFEDAFEPISVNKSKVPAKAYLPVGTLPIVDQGQTFIGGYTNDLSLAIDPGDGVIVFGDHTRTFKRIDFPFAAGADGIKVLRPILAEARYAYYACLSLQFPNKGYSRHYSYLKKCKFPIAPLPERERIVSKIEELFSEIEEGMRALQKVQKLMKRYRQSMLKDAVTGELTREWREKHKGKLESGEALFARILKARREAWETSELEKMKAKGQKPTNNNWKTKYKEPIPPDTTDLPELPAGWVWASLDQLTILITSGSRGWKEHYSESGAMFIRAQNLKHDALNLDDIAFVNLENVTEGLRTRVTVHDLLVTITGANVTKSALVKQELPEAYVSQHVALVRPALAQSSGFLFHWIVSAANGRHQLLDAAYGAGKPGLSLEDLKQVTVALPCLEEQRRICDAVDVETERLAHLTSEVGSIKPDVLRQTLLRSAFSGQLVRQNPTDEPASILLERIASGHNGQKSKARPNTTRRKKVIA
ncbi:restriction endonuclease subunit S [Tunturiibacter lichenicola]|uniref:restriction endonuclease subunit S n=1 Tax=Tunturiibacter lichenicola TaxID=2051959 RepID=UPI003D9B0355